MTAARLYEENLVLFSEQASSLVKSGKTCKWGGREIRSILIIHGWRMLWNECESLSFRSFVLFLNFFFLSWRNASGWGTNRIQLGSCKLAEAMLLAMDTCLSASSSEKKPAVLSEDRWVWIPSEHWLSLIGLKDWEPERMNGFCWSLQGWTQRERQWVPCVCACMCACQLLSPYGLDRSSRKWKRDRNTPP